MIIGIGVNVVVIVVIARLVGVVLQRHVDALDVTRWIVAEILALQEEVNLAERGSLAFIALPTLVHQVTDLPGALEWGGQSNTSS